MSTLRRALRTRFLRFRKEAVMLWFAFRHPDTPRGLKLASLFAVLYLLSPIDLIPFTVPVLGVVDDLIIFPWLLGRIAARLPQSVQQQTAAQTDRAIQRWFKRPLLVLGLALLALVTFWALVLWLILRALGS